MYILPIATEIVVPSIGSLSGGAVIKVFSIIFLVRKILFIISLIFLQVIAPQDLQLFASNLPAVDQLGRKSQNKRFWPFIYTELFTCVFLSGDGNVFLAPASFGSDRIAR